jgi:hypothetical protein
MSTVSTVQAGTPTPPSPTPGQSRLRRAGRPGTLPCTQEATDTCSPVLQSRRSPTAGRARSSKTCRARLHRHTVDRTLRLGCSIASQSPAPVPYALLSNSHPSLVPPGSGSSNRSASALGASSVIRYGFRRTSPFERRIPKNLTSNKLSIRTSSRSVPESRRCGRVPRTLVPHGVSHARQPAWAPYGDYFGPCQVRTVFACHKRSNHQALR